MLGKGTISTQSLKLAAALASITAFRFPVRLRVSSTVDHLHFLGNGSRIPSNYTWRISPYTWRISPSLATISYRMGFTKKPRNRRETRPATMTIANGF